MSFVVVLVLLAATLVDAEERRPQDQGGTVYSLGLPGRNLAHGGITVGSYRRGDQTDVVAYGSIATYRDIIHPAYTVMGLWGEMYVGYRDDEGKPDAGLRAMIMAPAFKLGAGVDYNLTDEKFDAIISLMLPLRRGGLLGHGSMSTPRTLGDAVDVRIITMKVCTESRAASKEENSHD